MKKRLLSIFCLISALAVMVVLFNNEKGETLLNNDESGVEKLTYPYSKEVLSTGVVYEFHGEFNFNEFRRKHNFHLERAMGTKIFAGNSTEIAEVGQFYLLPGLGEVFPPPFDDLLEDMFRWEHIEGESSIILVHYCTETDNWVIQLEFPENTIKTREPSTFAINRSNGEVTEFSRNRNGLIRDRLDGWRRTH